MIFLPLDQFFRQLEDFLIEEEEPRDGSDRCAELL